MPEQGAGTKKGKASRLLELLQQTRWNNGILIAMIIVSVGGFTYINFIWDPAAGVSDTALMKAAAAQISKDADEIIVEGATLAVNAAPPVSDALVHQVKADLPVYLRTLDEEGTILLEDLKASLAEKLKAQFKEYVEKHHQVLEEEIPEVAQENAVAKLQADFDQAMERLIERYFIDEFAKQAERTEKLWHQLQPVKQPAGEKTLEEELLKDVPRWLALRVIEYGERQAEKRLLRAK